MCIIGVIGSTIGTIILKYTGDQKFSKLVPLLLLFATILLWLSPYINRYIKYRNFKENNSYIRYSRNFLQIFAAIYGGFFGAGVGIILLASLGISGMTNMKEMNAAKNLTAFFINITALIIFIASSKVAWAECIAQMIGAIAGGFWGGMLVSKLPDNAIRYFVLGLGIFLTIRYAYIYY
jgi:uncharacterized membrane protein YfcA